METNLYPAFKPVVTTSALLAEVQPPSDKKVPAVKALDGGATLPSDKAFVAQVVTARLSGTAFPITSTAPSLEVAIDEITKAHSNTTPEETAKPIDNAPETDNHIP